MPYTTTRTTRHHRRTTTRQRPDPQALAYDTTATGSPAARSSLDLDLDHQPSPAGYLDEPDTSADLPFATEAETRLPGTSWGTRGTATTGLGANKGGIGFGAGGDGGGDIASYDPDLAGSTSSVYTPGEVSGYRDNLVDDPQLATLTDNGDLVDNAPADDDVIGDAYDDFGGPTSSERRFQNRTYDRTQPASPGVGARTGDYADTGYRNLANEDVL